MIKLHNITKIFQTDHQPMTVLDRLSLEIPAGQIFGVIGASGAGKSTLIRCVNLLERPNEGQVLVNGVDLMTLNEPQLILERRKIGMIFQQFNLLSSRTAFENIALPLELAGWSKSAIQQRVNELLDLVGLGDRKDNYPANLSGGQKQRVAIARALATNPSVLLCDEATSALDPATTQSILVLLKEINQRLGITILIITHEMEVVKQICHRVAVLDKGRLVEEGAVSEIFSNPQTTLAQSFIQSTFHIALPESYVQQLQVEKTAQHQHPVLKLEFTGKSVDVPVISHISKQLNVDFNILTSQMDYINGVKFGFMMVELMGEATAIEQAKQHLEQHHVKYQVLGYVG